MKTYIENPLNIKSWAEEDRPREKMILKGRHNLSDAELLAILLGSGSRHETAVALAQRILKSVNSDLNELGKRTLAELKKFRGVGEAKAISIIAALELGRRRQLSDIREKPQIKVSKDVFDLIGPLLSDLSYEEFWILLLNRANKVLGKELISRGGVVGTVVDAKIIFKKAIEGNAVSIILCHNHPSGTLRPSQSDIDITKRLKAAGETLEIGIIDPLIKAGNSYYSFAENGLV